MDVIFLIYYKKKHNVLLIEKNKSIFEGASFYNQNRLHLGYHYPRNYNTRKLCLNGYHKFLFLFPNLISFIDKNYYLTSNHSILDYNTIRSIFQYEKYDYTEVKNELFHNVNNTIMKVNECMIDHKKNEKYDFMNILRKIEYPYKINLEMIITKDELNVLCQSLYNFIQLNA